MSSVSGQKIYPLPKEQLDQEEDWVIEVLDKLLKEKEPSNAPSQTHKP